MGTLLSKPKRAGPDGREAAARTAVIDRMIKEDRKVEAKTIKILLLGAGESGKSTIIKQMRIINANGFQEDERQQIRAVIYSNVIIAFRVLLEIMHDEKISFANESTESHAELLENTEPDVDAEEAFGNINVKEAMVSMWKDAGVQMAVAKGHEYALNDNLTFYFESIDRMFQPGWIPDDQDMLHARLRTTGITETLFEMGHLNFRMMDVGGQRSERKKWIHCFEGVQCLLFMAALSGYDQCLVEDQNANQMVEALMLFEALVNGEWFKTKPIILFLNKIDLFTAKLPVSSLSARFPDYQGNDTDEEAAKRFFAEKFRAINRTTDREIYVHFTNATDTTLLKSTMQSVQDMVIQKNISNLIL